MQGGIEDKQKKAGAIGVNSLQELGSESEFFNKNKQLFERISVSFTHLMVPIANQWKAP